MEPATRCGAEFLRRAGKVGSCVGRGVTEITQKLPLPWGPWKVVLINHPMSRFSSGATGTSNAWTRL